MTLERLVLHPRSEQLVGKLKAHLPQGLIIEGPSGIGVLSVAKAIAASIGSPEFIIYPKKKVKGESVIDPSEGSVLIEDIRQLYEQTRTRQPGNQVYIIDTGEKSMTHGAQNAFLKLLEEPRAGLHFIIVTHQFDQLLPTIASRCQRLTLLPVTDEQTKSLIDELGVVDTTKKARLAFVGRGLPALIKRLAGDDAQYNSRVAIMSDAKTMITGTAYDKLAVIHRYRDNRAHCLILIDDINHQLQTVLRGQPDTRIVRAIERHLEARSRIAAGGNIRLQLTSDVL
jgi:DNA polymerase-3 subunit delta'